MLKKSVDLIGRQLKQYPWLWAISRTWKSSDVVNELTISPEVLSSSYDEKVLWWIMIEAPHYFSVENIDSRLLLDGEGKEISTLAHRIVYHLSWHYSSFDSTKFPIAFIASRKLSYGSQPNNPCMLYRPQKNRLIMNLVCQVHSPDPVVHLQKRSSYDG